MKIVTRKNMLALGVGLAILFNATAAEAKSRHPHRTKAKSHHTPSKVSSVSALSVDKVKPARAVFVCVLNDPPYCRPLEHEIFRQQIDAPIPPASLTKIMTAYETYRTMLERGHDLDTPFLTITAQDNATGRLGEVDGVQSPRGGHVIAKLTGKSMTYRHVILSLTVSSANNAAVAAANNISGSEAEFASRITARAKEMGAQNTTFKTASGMPATGQLTTARDMATMLTAIVSDLGEEKFRELYGQPHFTFNGVTYSNTLRIIGNSSYGIIGSKTGWQNGVSNVAMVTQLNGQLAAVVILGSPNRYSRDNLAGTIIHAAFEKLSTPAQAQDLPPAPSGIAKNGPTRTLR